MTMQFAKYIVREAAKKVLLLMAGPLKPTYIVKYVYNMFINIILDR